MNRTLGWILAIAVFAAGWHLYGWPGIVMAVTIVVFWLLLQFGRALRIMQNAGRAPVGMVPSAVMLNARLKAGMTMQDMLQVSKSLARQTGEAPETWEWADEGGSVVAVVMHQGRLQSWHLTRPEAGPAEAETGTGAPSP